MNSMVMNDYYKAYSVFNQLIIILNQLLYYNTLTTITIMML